MNDIFDKRRIAMCLVTIIVPIYNVEKYLAECIDSLLNQTYINLEIILVDDGSTDNSGKICDDYLTKDSRIRVIHKNNEGLGYARNSGIEIASGDYITFIDSDDTAEKDLIENLVNGINKNDFDTCIGGYKRITDDGKIKFIEEYPEQEFYGNDVYNILFSRMLGSAPDKHDVIKMSVWNVMYSASIIKKYNVRFPSEREFISEDIIWDSDYYKYAKKVRVIDSTSYNYRMTPGSLTKKYKPDMLDKVCILYSEMTNRINGDYEKIVRLQRQFFVNIRVCIKQENKFISKKSNIEIKNSIKKIVKNKIVHDVAVEYSKIIQQKRQWAFVMMIKYQLATLLFYILKTGRL